LLKTRDFSSVRLPAKAVTHKYNTNQFPMKSKLAAVTLTSNHAKKGEVGVWYCQDQQGNGSTLHLGLIAAKFATGERFKFEIMMQTS
jgi:hypothetical protein